MTQDFSVEELSNFIIRFLFKFYPRQALFDYDMYFGELVKVAYDAKRLYKEDSPAKFSTYLGKSFFNKMGQIGKREKEWYKYHVTTICLNNIKSNDMAAGLTAQHNEILEIVRNSDIPEKSKEIMISFLTKPHLTMKSLGEEFGVTKQRVNMVVNSTIQYFERQGIDIRTNLEKRGRIEKFHN